VLSEVPEDALPESESTVLGSRRAWKHQKVLESAGTVDKRISEVSL